MNNPKTKSYIIFYKTAKNKPLRHTTKIETTKEKCKQYIRNKQYIPIKVFTEQELKELMSYGKNAYLVYINLSVDLLDYIFKHLSNN